MVQAAETVEWIEVRNEVEALMLEYSLIKQHAPRFNIRLKDDKSYPFLAVTLGPTGTLWLDDKHEVQRTPAFPVHTVDTLGAGDIFHGAFALEFAGGSSIPEALRFASAAAALKCTRHGGAFACPQRAEVEELLAK